jgi:hypothetical protein
MIVSAICLIVISTGLPMFRIVRVRQHQPDDPVDEVADVGEAARLRAVAEHRHVFVAQRLRHERRDGAAVVDAHPRTVGVEDPHDLRVHAVVAVIRHRHRLGEALRFVVDAARPDRVDVAPVGFRLRMLERIAVDLRGRRDHEARPLRFREAERLVRAERADLERRNRQLEVVDRACRAGPVQHEVDRPVDVDVVRDVVLDEREIAVREVRDVGGVAGQQVVDADHRVVAVEQRFGEVRSDEAGRAGDDDALLSRHACGRTRATPSAT